MNVLKRLGTWLKDDCGVAAVEFAMVAVPFFTLLLGTVEVSIYFATSVVLQGASESAARIVRTGQEQSGDPQAAFEERLCDMVSTLISCDELKYEALAMESGTFAEAAALEPEYDENGELVAGGFEAGSASSVVLIRTSYRYEFFIPFIGHLVTSGNGNAVTLTTAVVIKNEPYNFGT